MGYPLQRGIQYRVSAIDRYLVCGVRYREVSRMGVIDSEVSNIGCLL